MPKLRWICILATLWCSATVHSQSPSIDTAQMQAELDRLAQICDQLNLTEQADLTRHWTPADREDQQRLFLPVPEQPVDGSSPNVASWAKHFATARSSHGEYLFTQAEELARSDEAACYRKLWQVLREDPDHAGAKRVLGPLARGFQVRPRVTRGRVVHRDFGWQPGSYTRIMTPHFIVTSRADSKASVEMAQHLERFYVLWSQFFYPYWAPPNRVTERMQGRDTAWPKHRGIEVILLKDRAEYLQLLGVAEDNIGISVGYYSPDARKSFFYLTEDLDATLYHELTHQLLLEATSISARADAGTTASIWMIEGIALYFESLVDRGSYWTIGGLDSDRMQTARYRAVRDGYWPAWRTFCHAGAEEWKLSPSISRYYTHAAGLTHTFLDALTPEARNAYLQRLVAIYQGDSDSSELLQYLDGQEDIAKQKYRDLLVVTEADLRAVVASGQQPHDLVLTASQFSSEGWNSLEHFTSLQWLDVAFSNITEADLAWLADLTTLTRLSLEGTSISGEVLEVVAKLPNLRELDLAGCAIDDADLARLRDNRTLEVLWLSDTQVSDASLATLASLGKLKRCDIEGSKITPSLFRQRFPQLQQ